MAVSFFFRGLEDRVRVWPTKQFELDYANRPQSQHLAWWHVLRV
jgi:hypothetical protein